MGSIEDIVAEMRDLAANRDWHNHTNQSNRERLLDYADRIEKAVTNCNQFKMREALKYLRDASREFHHLILNSKHNEICDKYKYPAVAKISDAIANAGAVLAEPPRNCDLYASRSDAWVAFRKKNQQSWYEDLHLNFPDWLFAEAKGEAK